MYEGSDLDSVLEGLRIRDTEQGQMGKMWLISS